mgnify:CR=1 FL=1
MENSAPARHWRAYLLGPITGLPALVRGLSRDDDVAAFHGAQATAFGLIFAAGLALLGVLLRAALPVMGLMAHARGQWMTALVWLCYYAWVGGGIWVYMICLVTARSGGWRVGKALTNAALMVESAVAFIMHK